MLAVSRMTDLFSGTCYCHPTPIQVTGTIVTGSSGELVDGLGQARLTDMILASCGHTGYIITCSSVVKSDTLGIARVGDLVSSSCLSGTILTGSSVYYAD